MLPTEKKIQVDKNRLISFEELQRIVGDIEKTKEEKRHAFYLYFGERKKRKMIPEIILMIWASYHYTYL